MMMMMSLSCPVPGYAARRERVGLMVRMMRLPGYERKGYVNSFARQRARRVNGDEDP